MKSRETARQTYCSNNQKQLANAVQIYEQERKSYPGYVNPSFSPSNPRPLSWLEVLLPYVDQEALFKNSGLVWQTSGTATSWRLSTPSSTINSAPNTPLYETGTPTKVPLYGCPSDSDRNDYETSYVANCGVWDQFPTNPPVVLNPDRISGDANPYPKYNGMFYCQFGLNPPNSQSPSPVRMTSTDVKDGLAQTILISENVQAGPWYASGQFNNPTAISAGEQIEPLLGFVWWPNGTGPDGLSPLGINQGMANRSSTGLRPPSATPDYMYARPSSNHPGVVVVAYCDGHVDTLRADIDPALFIQSMTPDGANASLGAWRAAGSPGTYQYANYPY